MRAQKDAAKPFALLTAQKGNERFEITGYETSIGRAKNSDIRLDYAFISRNHAVIAYRSKEWRLYDTDSSGGVTVNGKKVKDYAILQNGDSIGFADYEFLFSPSPDKTDSLDIYSYKDPTKRGKKRNKHDKKR